MNAVFRNTIGFLLLVLLPSAWAAQPVGYIKSMEGPGSAFELHRDGKDQPAAIFTKLYKDDQLQIKKEKCESYDRCTLTLQLGEQQIVQLDSTRSLYQVENVGGPLSLPDALMQWAVGWFISAHKEHRQAVRLITKGGSEMDAPLSIPLLAEDQARLTAGERTLYLTWQGGKAPYRVRIFRDGARDPLLEQNLPDRRLVQPQLTLTEGNYRVVIDDAQAHEVTGRFQAFPEDRRPVMPAEFTKDLEQSSLEPAAKNALFAAWLVEQAQGTWALEAYQWVAGIDKEYYPAALVRERVTLEIED